MDMVELPYSSVTPKSVYFTRRRFLAGAVAALGLGKGLSFANTKLHAVKSPFSTTEKPTPYQDVTSYNNFYEFGTGKGDPVRAGHTICAECSPANAAYRGAEPAPAIGSAPRPVESKSCCRTPDTQV